MTDSWSLYKKRKISQVLVAHTCNPSYSGGRDQEDHGSKTAQADSSQDLISKKPSQKKRRGREKKQTYRACMLSVSCHVMLCDTSSLCQDLALGL
jgi:hypothetical protein